MTDAQRNWQELTEKTRVNNNDSEVHFCSLKTIKQRAQNDVEHASRVEAALEMVEK